ncbi:MAG TPA: post-COAP-1 domain-containing protein, partial [Actinomycetota bacterium]
KLGSWLYPNPVLAPDPLAPALAAIGRTERGCTIHVFRNGGNGSAGPGEVVRGFDGVSRLPARQLVTAHYGAGVWHVDFSGPSSSTDGVAEDPRSTWGNTLGWNVMPGADTWSAKEYKGYVYAGDMARGFDVFALTQCEGVGCVVRPTNTPGTAKGNGGVEGEPAELSILSGPSRGGKAGFSLDVAYVAGQAAPVGTFTFHDKLSGRKVQSTAIDSLTIAGGKASITGRATVNGTPGVSFFAEAEDLGGKDDPDTLRLVLGDGYAAGGVLLRGKVEVAGGLVTIG